MNPTQYSPLALAFLGDAVFSLLARESLLLQANRPAGELHRMATQQVNARAQAVLAKKILPLLTQEEADILRRGKNAKPGHIPPGCARGDYALATGLEALFGWLWLRGELARARELFSLDKCNKIS